MADPPHVEKLKEGVRSWNDWRRESPVTPQLDGITIGADEFGDSPLWDGVLGTFNLAKANLRDASLRGAHLEGVHLSSADLSGADLTEAHLNEAVLCGADLAAADLTAADLRGADLEGAELSNANLQRADLTGANLQEADLASADLRRARLELANLERSNVTSVKYNRWARYRAIRVATCWGSPRFRRFAQDQEYLEEFKRLRWHKPLYWVWLVLSDCGRSFALWAAWSAAMAFWFGWVYHGLGPGAFNVSHLPWSFRTATYYSVVTFTTLGFGDVVPRTPQAANWVMAEVVVGYFMLGGLVSILATRLARRS